MNNGFHTLVSAALVASAIFGVGWSGTAPADAAKQKNSDHGTYRVSLSRLGDLPPLNEMHRWRVQLAAPDGTAISGAKFAIAGGLRDRPHPLPTDPRVTRDLGHGRYLIEGIKFDRHGWWRLKLEIWSAVGEDTVSFDIAVGATVWADWGDSWTDDELAAMKSLWIGSLPRNPAALSNKFAHSKKAAEFGHRLFFDTRLSKDGTVACATCHVPELAFTDGRELARGIGQTGRNAPTVIGAAYGTWQFWDGRKDSLWSQALGPFENPVEHGTTRAKVVAVVRKDSDYRRRYVDLFGPLPRKSDRTGISRAFVNLGKAIAAYERALVPGPSKFDRYVEAILNHRKPSPADQLNIEEMAGLKVFISDNLGQCMRCHNGPMFTDNHFHNIGSQKFGANDNELGRAAGIKLALADESNCRSVFSDAPMHACAELSFAKRRAPELLGSFKTPSLRFLPKTAPYMHVGQYKTMEDVIWHYRDVPPATIGESELRPLSMSNAQFLQIEDFLKTLDGPIAAPEHFLRPPD